VASFTHVQHARYGREDQAWVTDGSQRHEPDTVREVLGDRLGDPLGEPRLADTAGTGEGQEPDRWLADEITDSVDFALPPDEGRGRDGQGTRLVTGRNAGQRTDTSSAGSFPLASSCDVIGVDPFAELMTAASAASHLSIVTCQVSYVVDSMGSPASCHDLRPPLRCATRS
jgi:hypothetical protein